MDEIATSIIIPKDNPELASSFAKCKPGEKVTIEATVTGNDDTGLSADVVSVTPEYAKEQKPTAKKESATAYAKRMRRERMGAGKMSPMMEMEKA